MNNIDINNISYEYHRGRQIFNNFSLQLKNGETTFLTGCNGCGKTTLTKLIMGIIKPTSGEIKIFGKRADSLSLGSMGEIIGYVFQYPERQLFSSSVMDELTFPLIFKGYNKIETFEKAKDLLKIFDLEKVKNSYPSLLSYGEKRRLAIASVLMVVPKYLILDEPTASLDNHRIDALSDVLIELKNRKIGMLIISHNKTFIEKHKDRVIKLEGGQIYE
ncbi:MAG: ABC transporter ATP-binding protein [Tissierellia bacterium]|jgi:energy-coupling factor transport system ATP-binding protein|nr:ABC transporter ATP-binding protein [Tissierellia bacterium]MDD3225977.1 ABC transporter ATP-binding protein [Tissierellia bacterium]MDD3750822.1 ABC transporter ATP-binding protein [Tissierellia bacterium]MDD4046128.1 ABC transporter ATP-binding protein [Tissierellia bacterium]MDD4677591.1 ABC transporter ATP-binding protein [Tissierellia bacterium]